MLFLLIGLDASETVRLLEPFPSSPDSEASAALSASPLKEGLRRSCLMIARGAWCSASR